METSHESISPPLGDPIVKQKVPRSIFVIILVCFAGLYWYAAYGDTPAPEKCVNNFYQAYFDRDFETVAQNVSVFWSVNFLPQYSSMSAAELLENRPKIEKELAAAIKQMEETNGIPEGISIQVMPDYTRVGQESAIVVYEFLENGKETGMEAAILILENGQFRIFNISPVDDTVLDQIKSIDLDTLDKNFSDLLSNSQTK